MTLLLFCALGGNLTALSSVHDPGVASTDGVRCWTKAEPCAEGKEVMVHFHHCAGTGAVSTLDICSSVGLPGEGEFFFSLVHSTDLSELGSGLGNLGLFSVTVCCRKAKEQNLRRQRT